MTINSTAGGKRPIPITVTGTLTNPISVAANDGPDQVVQQGAVVTLAGSATGILISFR